jgi:hypothetical protein
MIGLMSSSIEACADRRAVLPLPGCAVFRANS